MTPPSPVEDAFLAYRATRDPAALAAVYDGCAARMLAVAMHIAGSSAAAEDAVQETFLFAMQNPDRWDETRPLVPWLLGILGNRLKQAACRARWTPDPGRLQLPEGDSPDTAAETTEVLAEIERAITHLPQPYRTVVLLRLRNGLSPADIAVALDRKPSTVRAQLTRGFEMLRKLLPSVVGALLVGSLASLRGQEGIRQQLLQQAGEMQRRLAPPPAARPFGGHGLAIVALLACAAVLTMTVLLWRDDAVAPTMVGLDAEPTLSVVARDEALPLDYAPAAPERSQPATPTATLRVSVRCGGVALPSAQVELEPLGDPPLALVHHTTTGRGAWREIASARSTPAELLRHARTGDDGDHVFAGLRPGVWICRALGHDDIAVVTAGADAHLTMTVEAGCGVVEGLVLGPDGLPAVDAAVWTSREHVRRFVEVVARTDDRGRFTLAVAPFTTIGAELPGFAPVACTVTPSTSAPRRSLVLQLQQAGASLAGVVVDGDARPVAGVTVQLGHPSDTRVVGNAVEPQVLARPHRTVTDSDGRFSFSALVPGDAVLSCGGVGVTAERLVVALRPGERAEAQLLVTPTASVEGTVRGADGAPRSGVSVSVGRRGELDHRATTTAEDGTFVLDGVAAGQPVLEVMDYRGGFAARRLHCAAGERARCDVVLGDADLEVRGQVIGDNGRAMTGVWIVCLSRFATEVLEVDRDGRFSVRISERVAALPVEVRVYDADPRDARGRLVGVPRLVRRGLRVGEDVVELRMPAVPSPQASLRGRLLDVTGAPLSGDYALRGEADDRRWSVQVEVAADGSFAAAGLQPGSYRITSHTAVWGTPRFEVAAGAVLDLGAQRLPVARDADPCDHAVQVALVFPASAPWGDPVTLRVLDDAGVDVLDKPAEVAIGDAWDCYVRLPAGRFVVVAESVSGLIGRREVVVDPASPPLRALPLLLAPR
ncbi:MAG: sigma-70 family RNA polymerase sigma factor [Planctomycetota bacterium]